MPLLGNYKKRENFRLEIATQNYDSHFQTDNLPSTIRGDSKVVMYTANLAE